MSGRIDLQFTELEKDVGRTNLLEEKVKLYSFGHVGFKMPIGLLRLLDKFVVLFNSHI